MDFHTSKQQGYLLVETLVSLAIAVLLMQVLVPVLTSSRNNMINSIKHMDRIELKEAIVDHFQSQLAPVLWRACQTIGAASTAPDMVIGNSEKEVPARIAGKSIAPSTDWLMAMEASDCRALVRISALNFSVPYSCSWKAGDRLLFNNCEQQAYGVVERTRRSAQGNQSRLRFNDALLIHQSGVLMKPTPYIWYVAKGKSEHDPQGAFWRTPQIKGNSLELWAGVEKLAIYPLLDRNLDGKLDTLAAKYASYPLSQLKGFWLELMVKDTVCRKRKEQNLSARYQTHRGFVWFYNKSCAFPMQFVVGL